MSYIIGLTYDLRDDYRGLGLDEEALAELDSEETIHHLERALESLGHRTTRIGRLASLVERLANGERWDLVFNIAEGMFGFGREAQVPALLDAYRIPYTFSDPLVCSLTLHKGLTKRIVRDLGLPTAPFHVVEHLADVEAVSLGYPLFAKPVAEGTGKGITTAARISSPAELVARCEELLVRFRQPVLLEEYLPGRELTVGLLGTGPKARVTGVLEIVLMPGAEEGVYSLRNKEHCEELVEYRLCEDKNLAWRSSEHALEIWRRLGCRDGGRIDFRLDASGEPSFLEVNPLAGLHPTHSDLPILCQRVGMTYEALLAAIVESAAERIEEPIA